MVVVPYFSLEEHSEITCSLNLFNQPFHPWRFVIYNRNKGRNYPHLSKSDTYCAYELRLGRPNMVHIFYNIHCIPVYKTEEIGNLLNGKISMNLLCKISGFTFFFFFFFFWNQNLCLEFWFGSFLIFRLLSVLVLLLPLALSVFFSH